MQIQVDDPRLGPRDKADIEDPKFQAVMFQPFNIHKRLPDGSVLRIFRALLSSQYAVQKIINPGVLDRRRKRSSRESREILLSTSDRAQAIQFFNAGGCK